MLNRTLRSITGPLMLAAALALPAAAAAAPTGTQAWRLGGARDAGRLAARSLSVTLVLAPRNAAGLRSLVSGPHAALTPAEFTARYAPATATLGAIRHWADVSGLKVTSVSSNRLLVRLAGSSTNFARALHTQFDSFRSGGVGQFFQITRPAVLPRSFASHVSAVLGLSSLGHLSLRPTRRTLIHAAGAHSAASSLASAVTSAASGVAYPNQYGPKDLWSIYDAPSTATGSGQQLAIIAEGDLSQPKKDLATFESQFGLPVVTWNQIDVGTPSSDTSGDDEWDLDSQYSTGFAPGVSQLDVYVGPSLSDADILSTVNRFVTDDISKQGSFSAGECELLAYASGFTAGLDTVLQQASAQGQSLFTSSGDTGAACPAVVGVNGVPAGLPGVNYPASSPFAIGVGGTSILAPSGPTEIAWYAGGGGSSLIETTPSFQSATKVGGLAPLLRRGVPDVSLDADPNSGYEVVVGGTMTVIGGTSASAPSWQGIWARAQGAHGGALGFAGPVLYREPASAFHDITLGGNPFPALPGWDYATGLGTPDIAQLVSGA